MQLSLFQPVSLEPFGRLINSPFVTIDAQLFQRFKTWLTHQPIQPIRCIGASSIKAIGLDADRWQAIAPDGSYIEIHDYGDWLSIIAHGKIINESLQGGYGGSCMSKIKANTIIRHIITAP